MGFRISRHHVSLLILTFLLILTHSAVAENVVLMAKKKSPVLLKLKASLEKQSESFHVTIVTQRKGLTLPKESYLINVGLTDLDEKITQQAIGTISVLITEKQSKNINDQAAIYVEPPFKRQLNLARLIFPGEKIGLLVANQEQENLYLKKLNQEEIALLNIKKLSDYSSLNKALYKVLKGSSLLLGIYDNSIYNAKNIKNILITSYRQQKVLIGPSKAYLKAGSFSSTFSDLSHVARRISDVVLLHNKENTWLESGFNPYFSVIFNKQVANSLNIQAFDANEIVTKMGGQVND